MQMATQWATWAPRTQMVIFIWSLWSPINKLCAYVHVRMCVFIKVCTCVFRCRHVHICMWRLWLYIECHPQCWLRGLPVSPTSTALGSQAHCHSTMTGLLKYKIWFILILCVWGFCLHVCMLPPVYLVHSDPRERVSDLGTGAEEGC